uniref:Uncharacterized protein n=1 Tax=Arundo donax TaxID=35708 RepID=A0A0A9HRJ4_ARUDO
MDPAADSRPPPSSTQAATGDLFPPLSSALSRARTRGGAGEMWI